MSILKVENLAFSYRGLSVLEDVSFSMDSRECVALIGPNGAGKTTLLDVITGLLRPLKGRIYLREQDVTQFPTRHRVSLGMARSFQKDSLFLEITVLENVLIALREMETSSFEMVRPTKSLKNRVAKAGELLKSVDLWHKRDVKVASLSHGDKRHLDVVLALASEPQVLLLDEPSAGLSRGEAYSLSARLRSLTDKSAILFAAHDLDLVRELSDRVLVLYYGRIIADGTPAEIQADLKVQEVYLGTKVSHAPIK